MIEAVRTQLTTVLEGLGYTVKQAEITSLDDLKTLVNQIKPEEYPYCTISFGDGEGADPQRCSGSPDGLQRNCLRQSWVARTGSGCDPCG